MSYDMKQKLALVFWYCKANRIFRVKVGHRRRKRCGRCGGLGFLLFTTSPELKCLDCVHEAAIKEAVNK